MLLFHGFICLIYIFKFLFYTRPLRCDELIDSRIRRGRQQMLGLKGIVTEGIRIGFDPRGEDEQTGGRAMLHFSMTDFRV